LPYDPISRAKRGGRFVDPVNPVSEVIMPKEKDFEAVFDRLKAIMKPYEPHLVLKVDQPGNYYLDTH
jgi:hypothetical protein